MSQLNEYKNMWVYIETEGGKPKSVGYELLSAARPLADRKGCELVAVVIGHQVESVAAEAVGYGADRVLLIDAPEFASYTTDAFASGAFTVQTKPIAPIPALGTLQVLRLPDALTAVEEEAFAGGAFEAVILPAGCTSVGSRAFAGCANLLYVKVPAGALIAPDAFDGCPNVIIDRSAE